MTVVSSSAGSRARRGRSAPPDLFDRDAIDAKLERARMRRQEISRQYQAKVDELQKKAESAKGNVKAAAEARIAKVRNDYQNRQQA